MKYLLWLFIPILLLGQVKTVTQTGVKRSMIRGDATTLTWTVSGDYSSDSLLFIAMDNDSNAVLRLTTSGGLTASYSSPNTTITGTIHAATTENFIAQNYLYDISSVTDSVTLIMGLLSVIADVSNLEDTVLAPIPYYTVALDTPAANNNFIIGMDSNNVWYQKTLAQTKTILGIDTLSGNVNVDVDSLYTYWVNKHEAQTITGQKNFMGTVKIFPDTVLTLGTWGLGSRRTGLYFDKPDTLGNQINIFDVVHTNDTVPDWSLTSRDWRFRNQTGHGLYLKQNGHLTKNIPDWGTAWEAPYQDGDSLMIWEKFELFNDYPTNQYSVRPFGVTTYRLGNVGNYKYTSEVLAAADMFKINDEAYNTMIQFRTMTYGYSTDEASRQWEGNGNSMMYIIDSMTIAHAINNFDWLYQQKNGSGSAKSIIKVDTLNNVVISPSGEEEIDLKAPLKSTSIKWNKNDNTGTFGVTPDSTDKLNFSGTGGVGVQQIDVTYFTDDTTGLVSGKLWVDPNNGNIRYTIPEELVANSEFTDWTGDDPDSWTIYFAEDAGNYVEESPSGHLHLVVDGNTSAWGIRQDVLTLGVTYGYSFVVSAVGSDTVVVSIDGENFNISQAGTYTGEVTASTSTFIQIREGHGAADITFDNFRIWEKNGAGKKTLVDGDAWSVFYTDANGAKIDLGIGASGTVLKSTGTSSAPSWQSDLTGAGGSAYADSVTINGRHVPGDSLMSIDDVSAIVLTYVDSNYVLTSETSNWDKNSSNDLTITTNFGGDVSGTYDNIAVTDDSHNHVISNVDALQDSLTAKANRSELGTGAYATIANYSLTSHTHTEFYDTLSKSWGVMDTVTTGDYVGWKVENNITITEVAAYTNTGTVTFNFEERGETTPNTAGTDVMTSDLVADTDQQETGTFSNAGIARDAWLILNVTSITGDPTIFGVTIRYVKAN